MLKKQQQVTNLIKSIILIGLLTGVFMFNAVIISSYPQHLYLNNNTVIESIVGNFNNSTVNIRGNQVQYSSGDIIFLEGRDYIRITGNQVQLGGDIFTSAIRTISASLSQNVLFEQKIGSFGLNSAGKLVIDDVVINLIPVSRNVLNVRTSSDNYNVELINNIVYIKKGEVMLKLVQNNNDINIYLIGTKNFNKILFVKI